MTFISLFCSGIIFYKLMVRFTDKRISFVWLLILSGLSFGLLFMNLMNMNGWQASSLSMSPTPGLIVGLFILFYLVSSFFIGLSGVQEKGKNVDLRVLFFLVVPLISGFLTMGSLKLITVAAPNSEIWEHGKIAQGYTNPADFHL